MRHEIIKCYDFVFKQVYNSGKLYFFISFFFVISSGILPIVFSFVFKQIIDTIGNMFRIETIRDSHSAIVLIIIYIGIIIFQDIILMSKNAIYRVCSISFIFNIQSLLVKKISKIHYEKLYSPQFQDDYANVLTNSQYEPLQVITSLFTVISLIIQFVISATILCNFNFIIFISIILCLIPNMISKLALEDNYVSLWENQIQNYRKMNYFFDISTSKTFLKEIRLYNLKNYFSKKREKHYLSIIKIWDKFSKNEFFKTMLTQFIAYIGICGAIIWLLSEILHKKLVISDFIFYWGVIFSLQNLCLNLVGNVSSNYKSMLFVKKIIDFINLKEEMCFGTKLLLKQTHHTFKFENVFFKYEGSNRTALKNINLEISTGEKICIVGRNGCGKTTLINLLLRNLLPSSGKILLDGVDINNYSNEEYSSLFSCVYQDWQKYAVTLRDYIAFGDLKNINNMQRIELAAKKAVASEFITKLKGKYESILTRMFDIEGEELSVGQWQKLVIARAFFSNSNVLIFDEPTSAIDSLSELEIYENINNLPADKMVLLISHRMYAPKKADKVIFIDSGSIVDVGTHKDLIKRCRGYVELFNAQAKGYK